MFIKSGGFRASTLAPISVLITSGEDPDGGWRRKSRSYCMSSMARYMCSHPVSGDRNRSWQSFTSALGSLKDKCFFACSCLYMPRINVKAALRACTWCEAPVPGTDMWAFPPKLTCFNALNLMYCTLLLKRPCQISAHPPFLSKSLV